ncbi:MAG: 2Fe-2S iron-sulfur cluster-binding protein [Chloroflexota bacterium]
MTVEKSIKTRLRLPPTLNEEIDRDSPIQFRFNGKTYPALQGDSIASALAASGVKVFSRSFKYHRPRGLMCCAGHCPNCLVQVGSEPNVRACIRPVEADMYVKSQNTWPSLEHDLMSLTAIGSRLTPAGFYYKAFIYPPALWPTYEKILRRLAGLGVIDPQDTPPPNEYHKEYRHTEVAVIGGGPAGLSAAISAAEQGLRVLLIDENPSLGGHLLYTTHHDPETFESLVGSVAQHPGITILNNTVVLGVYEDNWLAAMTTGNERLVKIRAQTVIYATGAYEQPLVFTNNDLPGIMLGSAVERLLHRYRVVAGSQAVVVTANDDGYKVAADLHAAGVDIAAIAEIRPKSIGETAHQELVALSNTPVYFGFTILRADGRNQVRKVTLVPIDEVGNIDHTHTLEIACDLVVVSVGWSPANGLLYQAGGRMTYDRFRAEFLPNSLPEGIFAAGRVAGSVTLEHEMLEGQLAGQRAAAYLGRSPGPDLNEIERIETAKLSTRARTSTQVKIPGTGKQFLCYCEDVTAKDLETSIAEGYDSIELLKRYSTISMGPCQGKMCSQNTIHLCARANNWTVEQTGTTTSRPPTVPVSLGALAGRPLEPVQVSPIHKWHKDRHAAMMVAGLWIRPEHYGDPLAEVRAVRERVGLIDVSTLGKFKLAGPGVPDFLSKIYINKWHNLAIGRVRYGVMCNDEGVILDDGVTARIGESDWYMTTTSSGSGAIFEWLQWWLQSGWGEGIHLVNVSEVYAAFNLAGPRSRETLEMLTESDLSNESMPYMHTRELVLAGVPCRLLRIGFTGELSYEIHCPSGYALAVWEALLDAGQKFEIEPFGIEAQRILRLEKAHLIVGQDTDGLSDPIAADMELAVKLDKPDFLGQRAIMRVKNEEPAQRLVGFKMVEPHTVPDEGLQIVEPRSDGGLDIIGWITSCRFSPTLGETIGLCWIAREIARQPGKEFLIRMNGHLEKAYIHHGSFYDPEGRRLRM